MNPSTAIPPQILGLQPTGLRGASMDSEYGDKAFRRDFFIAANLRSDDCPPPPDGGYSAASRLPRSDRAAVFGGRPISAIASINDTVAAAPNGESAGTGIG